MPRGLISGGQDIVRLWDLRSKNAAMETRVGRVNDILAHKLPDGVDGRHRRRPPRPRARPSHVARRVHLFEDHRDFVYSLTAIGHIAVSGGGDGIVRCHDLREGQMFEVRGNNAAVRAMHADSDRLVCAGDDGSVLAFEFSGGGGNGPKRAGWRGKAPRAPERGSAR